MSFQIWSVPLCTPCSVVVQCDTANQMSWPPQQQGQQPGYPPGYFPSSTNNSGNGTVPSNYPPPYPTSSPGMPRVATGGTTQPVSYPGGYPPGYAPSGLLASVSCFTHFGYHLQLLISLLTFQLKYPNCLTGMSGHPVTPPPRSTSIAASSSAYVCLHLLLQIRRLLN